MTDSGVTPSTFNTRIAISYHRLVSADADTVIPLEGLAY